MRILILSTLAVFSIGCKGIGQNDSDSNSSTPKADAQPLIKIAGCSVSKAHGVLSVSCSDGSAAEVSDAPSIIVKDANGAALESIAYLSIQSGAGPTILNKTSGHVIAYDWDGSMSKISKVYFDGDNCFGNAYAYFADNTLKNRIAVNNNAYPGGAQGLKITAVNGVVNMRSYFEAGNCTAWIGGTFKLSTVVPVDFHESDPLTIALPLELSAE